MYSLSPSLFFSLPLDDIKLVHLNLLFLSTALLSLSLFLSALCCVFYLAASIPALHCTGRGDSLCVCVCWQKKLHSPETTTTTTATTMTTQCLVIAMKAGEKVKSKSYERMVETSLGKACASGDDLLYSTAPGSAASCWLNVEEEKMSQLYKEIICDSHHSTDCYSVPSLSSGFASQANASDCSPVVSMRSTRAVAVTVVKWMSKY